MIVDSSSSELKGCCVNPTDVTLAEWGGEGFGARARGGESAAEAASIFLRAGGGVDGDDSSLDVLLCSQSSFSSCFTVWWWKKSIEIENNILTGEQHNSAF